MVPLSCGRVALVVGDVMGHGIRAAATMGQQLNKIVKRRRRKLYIARKKALAKAGVTRKPAAAKGAGKAAKKPAAKKPAVKKAKPAAKPAAETTAPAAE